MSCSSDPASTASRPRRDDYFHTSAAALSASEAALLAAVLPNPLRLHADRPSRYVSERRDWILGQMHTLGEDELSQCARACCAACTHRLRHRVIVTVEVMAAGKLHELDAVAAQLRTQAVAVVIAIDAKRRRYPRACQSRAARQGRESPFDDPIAR